MPSIGDRLRGAYDSIRGKSSDKAGLYFYDGSGIESANVSLPEEEGTQIIEVKGWEELRSKTLSTVSNANPGSLNPTVLASQAINKYRSWVYPCVNLIQRKAAEIPYYLYKEVGQPNDEEFDRILDHPVIHLLKRPNKYMSGRFLKQITQMHLDLCGCAFWYIVRNGVGVPVELHPMNPHELVKIELGDDTDSLIKKFVFSSQTAKQRRTEYMYDEIVYFHYPHPQNPMLPYTPIQALAHHTDLDMYLQVYEKDFFQNGAQPSFVIVSEQPLNKTQAERLSEGWNAKHRGPGKQHKPAILSRNVRIEQLGMSARDFEFMGLSEWIKDNILAAYNVPEAMLGLYESFSKGSTVTAETTFVKYSLNPRLKLFEDVINYQLLPQFGGTQHLEFCHESALPKDDEWETAKKQTELTLGLIAINEIRKKEGKKPYKSKLCDVPWLNGQPILGCDEEADKLWMETTQITMGMHPDMQPPMGGMGGQPAMGGGQQMMGGPAPVPAAQGAMGAMGGRPPGQDLNAFLQESLRASAPGLSTLLNAARGHRGGLQALLNSSPNLYSFEEMLGRGQYDQAFTKFLTKGIQDYIETTLSAEDRFVFKSYERMVLGTEVLEPDYQQAAEEFITKRGKWVSEIVRKNVSQFITKDPAEGISLSEIREAYMDSADPHVTKAAHLGAIFGRTLVEKGTGNSYDIQPEQVAQDAAGVFLSKSADLRAGGIRDSLVKVIRGGLSKGLKTDHVADMIEEKFADIGRQRAFMIARTELAGANDVGADKSFEAINKKAGKMIVKQAKLWTALDERVCKDPDPNKNCQRWHDEVLKDYEKDITYKETAVLHPNCRCVRIPVFGEI